MDEFHRECLNDILANACGRLSDEEVSARGYQEFYIELHCSEFVVRANELGDLKYRIVSWERLRRSPLEIV
jgi:hypothetical protein